MLGVHAASLNSFSRAFISCRSNIILCLCTHTHTHTHTHLQIQYHPLPVRVRPRLELLSPFARFVHHTIFTLLQV